ncbi:MAG: hypothetical protein IE884_08360 [Sulfuricurvum sp.]|nr:hypothetical protein [Sulfuricurvum sp.]
MMRFFALLLIPLWMSASNLKEKIDHIIVIYLENRSFDNLFYGYKGADTSDNPLEPYVLQKDGDERRYIRTLRWVLKRYDQDFQNRSITT